MSRNERTRESLADFLRWCCEHHLEMSKQFPCCDLCKLGLIRYTDQSKRQFAIKWYDRRKTQPASTSDYVFQLYKQRVAKSGPESEGSGKELMKQAILKLEKSQKVRKVSDKETSEKIYEFLDPWKLDVTPGLNQTGFSNSSSSVENTTPSPPNQLDTFLRHQQQQHLYPFFVQSQNAPVELSNSASFDPYQDFSHGAGFDDQQFHDNFPPQPVNFPIPPLQTRDANSHKSCGMKIDMYNSEFSYYQNDTQQHTPYVSSTQPSDDSGYFSRHSLPPNAETQRVFADGVITSTPTMSQMATSVRPSDFDSFDPTCLESMDVTEFFEQLEKPSTSFASPSCDTRLPQQEAVPQKSVSLTQTGPEWRAPRANAAVFRNFLMKEEEAGYELTPGDCSLQFQKLLRDVTAKLSRKEAFRMRVEVFARLDPEGDIQSEQISKVHSGSGFRIVSKDYEGPLGDVARFGPKTGYYTGEESEDIQTVMLDFKSENKNENVRKCIETFERAAIVLLWKPYTPPECNNLNISIEELSVLCWRLYCYRICKGYQPVARTTSDKVKRLDMCLKTPQKAPQVLPIHEFVSVFDLLQTFLKAYKLSHETDDKSSNKSPDGLRRQLTSFIGMRSTSRADTDDIPMRIQIYNAIVSGLVGGGTGCDLKSRDTRSETDSLRY